MGTLENYLTWDKILSHII